MRLSSKCNKFRKHCKGAECLNIERIEDYTPQVISTNELEVVEVEMYPSALTNRSEEDIEPDDNVDMSNNECSSEDPTVNLQPKCLNYNLHILK